MIEPYKFETGDVVACYGTGLVCRTISTLTTSVLAKRGVRIGPSHVAIIIEVDGSQFWAESTTLSPRECLISRKLVSGVQVHHPEDRVRDYVYRGGRVVVFRPSPIDKFTELENVRQTYLVRWFIKHATTYDTIGALISGTRVFKRTRLVPFLAKWLDVDLDSLFCSEMIAAILQRLGKMNLNNPTKYSPASLLRELVDQGTYKIADRIGIDENGVFSLCEKQTNYSP
jgi:hypothetical protein